ncbi:MAG TPA: ATP-binding protein [Candidatus Saccharimonadales bacterium]|jgi:serine/threonine-protein kinase RsbW|nr:ATP-binding protein [Candidatus Saccharimonadales bacterium]
MPTKPQRIEVVLETLIESIALAEEMGVRVAAEAGFGEDDQYKIGLAVHEGVMNAFQYGNQERRERKIHLTFVLHEEKLEIHVVDQGAGFRIEDVPDPRNDENVLSDSGRGVLLMRAFMDEVDVMSSAAGGAEVVMAKHHKR